MEETRYGRNTVETSKDKVANFKTNIDKVIFKAKMQMFYMLKDFLSVLGLKVRNQTQLDEETYYFVRKHAILFDLSSPHQITNIGKPL